MSLPSRPFSWALLVLAFAAIGCTQTHRPEARAVTPATRQTISAKPMIDFSRGAAGFPLVGHVPVDSNEHLVAELTAGYAARVELPTSRPAVTVDGQFPKLKLLRIDLSGGAIRSAYRPSSLKSVSKITPVASVKYLEYTAAPLHYDDAQQSLRLSASDVELGLLHGKGEREVLVMTRASDGHAKFDVTLGDLRKMVLGGAREGAGRAAFYVRDTQLSMTSDNPRSLATSMRVSGFWLLIPASFTMTGRIDVDKNFNAKLSGLSCRGNDVGGSLLAGFIDGGLKKYEGKVMPLATFPGDRLHMKDLQIHVDDGLHVDAEFGGE